MGSNIWRGLALAGALAGAGGCVSTGSATQALEDRTPQLFTCPDAADLRSLREDRREADMAREAAPRPGQNSSARLYAHSRIAAATYTMYDAFDEGGDPRAAFPDLGLQLEALIYGEPGRDTERRRPRARRAPDAPTFYGFVASHPRDRTRYVAFRGTIEAEEWARNLQLRQVAFAEGGQVHNGFHTIYRTLRFTQDGVRGDLMARLQALPPAPRTVFVGHSLGGALAALAVADAVNEPWAYGGDRLALTTFAAPRAGDPAFVAVAEPVLDKARVCNVVDVVPGVPVTGPGNEYVHMGAVLALSSFDYADVVENDLESRGQQIGCWHAMDVYSYMLDPERRRPAASACFIDPTS